MVISCSGPRFSHQPEHSDILHRIDALELTGALLATVLSGRNIELMLLSEGGNLTTWLAHATSFKGQARYLVLHPGQTVYMHPGAIPFVFRKMTDPALITGCEELSETEPEVTADKAEDWVACLVELVKQRREAQDWDVSVGREELELVIKTLEVGFAIASAKKLLMCDG
ncbi:hypothetical protein FGADI_13214 [Fusarium gaditjirri]|uniref:Uncharacterized protein n=1 Tax=Fusarium gaditjirri TaxID=282569 RepID=A0A8H4SQH1_9HYPO|nr:hypothetical protein FGADI_13214 [Fusarium gaditjirri]